MYDYATFDSLTVMPKFQSNRGSQNTNNEIQTNIKMQTSKIHSNHNAKTWANTFNAKLSYD